MHTYVNRKLPPQPATMFHTVFSAVPSKYMEWQSRYLSYHFKKSGQVTYSSFTLYQNEYAPPPSLVIWIDIHKMVVLSHETRLWWIRTCIVIVIVIVWPAGFQHIKYACMQSAARGRRMHTRSAHTHTHTHKYTQIQACFQEGGLTRLLSANHGDHLMGEVNTWVAPEYPHKDTDNYSPYNKPLAIDHFLRHRWSEVHVFARCMLLLLYKCRASKVCIRVSVNKVVMHEIIPYFSTECKRMRAWERFQDVVLSIT